MAELTGWRERPHHPEVKSLVPRSVCMKDKPGRSALYLERKGKLTLWVVTLSELVLLNVADTEDVVAKQLKSCDTSSASETEVNLVESEVASLETIGEGHPCQVTDGEHEAETIGCDVHGCEDGGLELDT